MRVVTAEEMRAIEAACVERGITLDTLMRRAGNAIADEANRLAAGAPILILAGPGNNGGDGLVAATRLVADGVPVNVYTFHRRDLMEYPGQVRSSEEDPDQQALRELLSHAGVVVDALLGIGQNRPPDGTLASILQTCAEDKFSSAHFLSADIPTGVNADTGAVPGIAFSADSTLCMGLAKCGAVVFPGAAYAGRVKVVETGIPADLTEGVGVLVPQDWDVSQMLPKRSQNSNKGSYGRVLVVAGSRDFLGAPGLASIAALRAGAGLAEVAATSDVCRSVAAHALEPIYLHLPDTDGRVDASAVSVLADALPKATSLVYGPGLGSSSAIVSLTRELLQALGDESAPPAVIDADGLNALSRIEHWWNTSARLILTPHPGEMSRLTGVPTAEIQQNRLAVAREYAARWGQTVVLKGAGTIVAHPVRGQSVNTTGSGNLATGGTGDVLSGIIAGLLAQGCDDWTAAVAGTYLHGRAGDLVAQETGMSGTLAGDLLAHIPRARRSVLEAAGGRKS